MLGKSVGLFASACHVLRLVFPKATAWQSNLGEEL
jgi:hypothetical protein